MQLFALMHVMDDGLYGPVLLLSQCLQERMLHMYAQHTASRTQAAAGQILLAFASTLMGTVVDFILCVDDRALHAVVRAVCGAARASWQARVFYCLPKACGPRLYSCWCARFVYIVCLLRKPPLPCLIVARSDVPAAPAPLHPCEPSGAVARTCHHCPVPALVILWWAWRCVHTGIV
jgi:hypothetical protein